MQETRKPQKLGKARIAQGSDGGPGEAVADVEDPEAAGAGEGVDGRGGPRGAAGHRGAPFRTFIYLFIYLFKFSCSFEVSERLGSALRSLNGVGSCRIRGICG